TRCYRDWSSDVCSSDLGDADLKAVVEGVRFVRRVTRTLRERRLVAAEELPGDHLVSDAELAEFVRLNAWGHHACGTCAIGPTERSEERRVGKEGTAGAW